MYKLIYTVVFLLAALGASAQNMPERSEVRRGNRQYNKGNYEKSIERYERALEAAPESFEATYNLGNALYKAERFDKAEQTMRRAAVTCHTFVYLPTYFIVNGFGKQAYQGEHSFAGCR